MRTTVRRQSREQRNIAFSEFPALRDRSYHIFRGFCGCGHAEDASSRYLVEMPSLQKPDQLGPTHSAGECFSLAALSSMRCLGLWWLMSRR
jgi:hypothetical protein